MWFYSGDHQPPHFHARRSGDWEVRVFFMEDQEKMIQIIRPPHATLKRNDFKALITQSQTHRIKLLDEWEAAQAG